jgi:uncharacterized protein YlzI (FlbEa/FlbD family)
MSSFIELTNHDDGDIALINLDMIEFISCHDSSGTVLVTHNGRGARGEDRFYHVRESYNLVKQKIFAKQRKIHPDNFNVEPKEELLMTICDKLCHFPRDVHDQDKLDEICEHCPLCEVLK